MVRPENFLKALRHLMQRPMQVYILPTRIGLLYAAIILISFLLSEVFVSTDLYVFTVLLTTLGLMSMLMTNSNIKKLTCALPSELLFEENQPSEIPLTIENARSDHSRSVQITLPIGGEKSPLKTAGSVEQKSSLKMFYPFENKLKRGCHALPNVRLESRFPLGLFRSWTTLKANTLIMIYPSPIAKRQPPMEEEQPQTENSPSSSNDSGQEEFVGLRPYIQNETQRRIDWKTYARTQDLMVKDFSEEHGATYNFSYERVPSEDIEERLTILSTWIHFAHQQGVFYSLEMPGIKISAARGESHFRKCLRELACYD